MAAAVEAPLAFLQKAVKTLFWDAVKAPQMSFGLVPKVLNAVDVVAALADENLAVVHAPVMKLRDIQHIINLKAVRIDDAVRRDFLSNDRDQRRSFSIRDDRGINLAAAL